jgi:hypothetical protein
MQPGLSEGARLINTFVAPSKTFTDIRRNASWWVPWLLLSVVTICFMQTVSAKIGYDQVTRNQIAASSRADKFDQLSPEQKAQQMKISTSMMKVIGWAAPVTLLIATLIIGGVLMALFNFGAGAEVTFKQSMAIVFYSWVPTILSSILGIVSIVVGSSNDSFKEGFNLSNPVATNPAYFMDPTKNKFLYGMASALDVFAIWIIILMGIGFSSVSNVKKGKAIGMIAAAYILFKLVASGIASL